MFKIFQFSTAAITVHSVWIYQGKYYNYKEQNCINVEVILTSNISVYTAFVKQYSVFNLFKKLIKKVGFREGRHCVPIVLRFYVFWRWVCRISLPPCNLLWSSIKSFLLIHMALSKSCLLYLYYYNTAAWWTKAANLLLSISNISFFVLYYFKFKVFNFTFCLYSTLFTKSRQLLNFLQFCCSNIFTITSTLHSFGIIG